MTLNSTIINAAFRESNFKGQGGALTTNEQEEGLRLLQSITDSFYGAVIGIRFEPWWIPFPNKTAADTVTFPSQGDYPQDHRDVEYPPSNSRVILRTTAAKTINLQYQPEDGAVMQFVDAGFTADVTINANGHFIGDGVDTSVTLTTAIAGGSRVPTRTYVFRADIATWKPIDTLIYEGENPFPSEFDDFWITGLAMRLAPSFGNEPKQITMLRYKEMATFVRNWYIQTKEVISGDLGLPTEQNYYSGRVLNSPDQGRVR